MIKSFSVSIHWKVVVIAFLCALSSVLGFLYFRDEPEISLKIGEPWEDMQQRSTAEIGKAKPGVSWYQVPKVDARLRLADSDYEFVTPLARFFTVAFTPEGTIRSVRMSPQTEPLLLDDTMKVLMDLQGQWRSKGWKIVDEDFPAVEDTEQWRIALRESGTRATYWVAGDKYQVMIFADRFPDSKRPNEERYLITLQLAAPRWVD